MEEMGAWFQLSIGDLENQCAEAVLPACGGPVSN